MKMISIGKEPVKVAPPEVIVRIAGSVGAKARQDGMAVTIRVLQSANITDLKRQVWERCGIPLLQQELRHQGHMLLDDEPVVSLGENPEVQLIRHLFDEEANRRILELAPANNDAAVKFELMRPARPDWADATGQTALHAAAEAGADKVARLLCDPYYLANMDAQMTGGATPMYVAAEAGHARVVEALLMAKADAKKSLLNGCTPLMAAAIRDHMQVVREIVNQTPVKHMSTVMEGGVAALHLACEHGAVSVAEVLLEEFSADREQAADDGRRPLHLAAAWGQLEIAQLLCRAGLHYDKYLAKKLATPVFSTTATVVVAGASPQAGANIGASGAELEARMNGGSTPMHLAAMLGHSWLVSHLFDMKADNQAATDTGATPLHLAVSGGHIECIQLWCQSGVKKDPFMRGGVAPVHIAAMGGKVDALRTLIEAAANRDTGRDTSMGGDGATPLHCAMEAGHAEVAQYLCDISCDRNKQTIYDWAPVHLAAKFGFSKGIQILLSTIEVKGPPEPGKAEEELSLSDFYNQKAEKELAEELAEVRRVKLDVATRGEGQTPMYLAAEHGQASCVSLLIASRADPNLPAKDGRTPLHVASLEGHASVVTALCDMGADRNPEMLQGWTPLHIAAHQDRREVAAALIRGGARRDFPAKDGWTPQRIAAQAGHKEMEQIIASSPGPQVPRSPLGIARAATFNAGPKAAPRTDSQNSIKTWA